MVSKNTKKYIEEKKEQGLYGVDFLGAIHPGETLQDELDFLGITQKELAQKIGYSIQTISRIVNGREPITTDIALGLERALGGHPSADFWLNMQSEYDKEVAKNEEFNETQEEIGFFKTNVKETFKELQKGGVFENYSLSNEESYKKAITQTKDFFGSHTLQTIQTEVLLGVPFRKYNRKNINKFNLSAILKTGERRAIKILKKIFVPEYNEQKFSEILLDLKKYSLEKPDIFLSKLQEECLSVGVLVVYVPNMTKTGFGGATIWVGNRPVILLKAENQYEDIFWFNFYHESAHILKHSKKNISINFEEKDVSDKAEIEANDFAEKSLIQNFEEITRGIERGLSAERYIEVISKNAGVSKGIVAGRLCNSVSFDGVWKILSQYRPTMKVKVDFV